MSVVDDQIGAPTSAALIADVTAAAVRRAVHDEAPATGVYHLTAGGETSWYGLARFVLETALSHGATLKLAPEMIVPIPTTAYPTPAARPANSRLDTSKLRAALGLSLPDWREGARQTVMDLLELRSR